MATFQFKKTYDFDDGNGEVEVELEASVVDGGFQHAFGTEKHPELGEIVVVTDLPDFAREVVEKDIEDGKLDDAAWEAHANE